MTNVDGRSTLGHVMKAYHTLEEANRILPDVEPHARTMVQLHGHLRVLSDTLAKGGLVVNEAMLSGRRPIEIPENLEPGLARAQLLYTAMMDAVDQIHALGAEVRGLDGLVDFWSWLDGRQEVLLCWRLGEGDIQFFHTPQAGFQGRQPVQDHLFVAKRAEPGESVSQAHPHPNAG